MYGLILLEFLSCAASTCIFHLLKNRKQWMFTEKERKSTVIIKNQITISRINKQAVITLHEHKILTKIGTLYLVR